MGQKAGPNLGEGTGQFESHLIKTSRKPLRYNQPYRCFLSLDESALNFLCSGEQSQ